MFFLPRYFYFVSHADLLQGWRLYTCNSIMVCRFCCCFCCNFRFHPPFLMMAVPPFHHGFTEAGIGDDFWFLQLFASRWFSDTGIGQFQIPQTRTRHGFSIDVAGQYVICNVWELCRLNFANSHRSSSLSPPSRGDLHLILLIALLYWYADKCYWKIVAYIDIWLDIDIWLEIMYCLCCDIIEY